MKRTLQSMTRYLAKIGFDGASRRPSTVVRSEGDPYSKGDFVRLG